MVPYNSKVWVWPLEEMTFGWIGERLASRSIRAAGPW